MAQLFNESDDCGYFASTPEDPQAVVEVLEARQLFSGSAGTETVASLLDHLTESAVQSHVPAKHVTAAESESSLTLQQRRAARISKEISIFTTHLRNEISRHSKEANTAKFQQHIAQEQAKFAKYIARQGGTFTPIQTSSLSVTAAAAAATPTPHPDSVVVGAADLTPTPVQASEVIHPATSPSPTPTPTPTPTPPVAPVLTGKAASSSSIALSWTAVTGASSYELQRSSNGGLSWTTLLNSTAQTFTDTNLSADTVYDYQIATIKGTTVSTPSTLLPVTTLLPSPAGVTATTKSATEIDLAWTKVTDATSYKIERSPDGNTWTSLTPSPALTAASVSYADTTALAGTLYYYRVSGIDSVGTSAPSTVVHTTTLPAVPVLTAKIASASEIDLSWLSITGSTAYNLQRSTDGGATWTTISTAAGLTYANTALTANTSYEYRVASMDAGGSSAPSTVATQTTILPAPTGLAATAVSATAINLTWAAGLGATSYKLERSPNNSTWTALTPSPALTGASIGYSDTTATTGSIFYYRISAINASGTSVPSTVANATTYSTAPTITATSKSASEIDLSWPSTTASTSYTLQGSSDGGNTWTTLTTGAVNTYANTALNADTAYKYRVVAIDPAGSSVPSAVASATTYLAPPTGLAATVASGTEIDLTWSAVTDATSYKLERSPDGTTWSTLTPSPALTGASVTYANTGLTAGTTYYYRISSINSVGTSVASSPIHLLTIPGAPTLTAATFSLTQVNLSWTAPTGATSYTLQQSADGGNTWTSLVTQAGTSYSNTSLAADSSYKYRVSATDATGTSVTSAVATALTLPVAPAGLSATPVSPTVIDVSWTPKSDATNYKLERSPDGNTWTTLTANPAFTGSSSTYVDTTLTAGSTYYYRISTVGLSGTSAPATAVHTQTYPATPTLSAKIVSATEVDLTWTAAANSTGYKLEGSPDGFSWSTLSSPTTTSFNNTALTADTTYYYRVSALNGTGPSATSNVLTETTILPAPAGVAVADASATEIDVTWTAVPDATSYKIERSPDGNAWTALTPNPALTASSIKYADTTATAGGTYYYRVSAIDASGTSVPSTVVHTQSVPAAPTLTPTVSSATQINLVWTTAANATSYTLQKSIDGGFTWTGAVTQAGTSYSDTTLTADTAYKYRVVANDSSGASAFSTVASGTTLENPPAGLAATVQSATAITLTWTAISDATSYKLERSTNAGTSWSTVTPGTAFTGSSASYTDTGVTAGSTDYYRISAISASGTSVPSGTVHLTTPPATTTLTATDVSASVINLAWTASSAASSYLIQVSSDGGTTWTQEALPASPAVTYVASGLSSDTLYKFKVFAVNAGGNSAVSNTASASTILAPPGSYTSGFTATPSSATQVNLAWTAVTDATSYTIQRSADNVAWATVTPGTALTGASTSYNDTGLTAGTTYYYRISAVDAAGPSVPSPVDPALTYPAAPVVTAIAASTTQINVSWPAVTGASSYIVASAPDGSTWTPLATQAGTTYQNTALTADTAYYYQVTAVNASGDSVVSNVASPSTLLAAPTGFSLSVASANEIDLTWSAVTDATNYTILRSPNGTTWTTLTANPALTSSSTGYADTTVLAGTTYYYTVEAVDAAGTSAGATTQNALTVPAAPTLSATDSSATVVNISWTAVKSATNYILQSAPDGSTWTSVVTQAGTTYSNTALTGDTKYYYQVIPVNATGNGAASNGPNVTTLLAAPTGLAATAASASEIDLTWTAETDATSYIIQRSTNQTIWKTLTPNPALTSSSTSYADTTVQAGTTYYYTIEGVDAVGASAPETSVNAMSYTGAPKLTASVASATVVNFSWNAVKGATNYVLQSSPDGSTWTSVVTQAGTTYANTGLTADTAYYYQVLGVDTSGNGTASATVPVTTFLAAPSGFTATVASPTEIDLAWTSETDATNYVIQRSLNQTVWTTLSPSPALSSASTSYADTSVSAGTTYYYRLFSVDAAGTSAAATATATLTFPAAPTLTATVASATSVNLAWNPVTGATSYIVASSPDGSTWTPISTQAGTSYTNTALTADTAYYYEVTPLDATGGGPASNSVPVTTLLAAPSGFTASVASATEIDLTWTTETDATNYTIQRSLNQTVWTTLAPSPALTSASTGYADTSVLAGTTYYYRLFSVDAAGTSAPATLTTATVPGTPTLNAAVASATAVNLSWTAAKGATSYLVQSSPDGSTWTTIATQAGTTYANTGLTADTAYYYQVIGVDAAGDGAPSNAPTLTTLLAAPSGFAASVASANEIDLTWSAETDATTYTIRRSTNQTVWTTLAPNPALSSSSTSFADTTVAAGTTYYYMLSGVDAAGTSATASTSALTVPASPALAATVSSATQANLVWTPSLGATSYLVQSSPDGSTWTTIATQAGTTYSNTALTADTLYDYQVIPVNATGDGAPSSTVPATTLLAAPSAFAVTAASSTENDLTWTAETDATNYEIDRSTNNTSWTPLVLNPALTGTSSSYADTTAVAGTNYYYRIESIDAAGTSAPATVAPILTLPATPTLTGTPVLSTEIVLSWTPAASATSYLLESSPDGSTWTPLATQAGTTYANTALTADTAYSYRVTANNATGSGATSSALPVTTMLAAPTGFAGTPASDTQINLTWTAVTDATSYQIEVSTNQTSWLPLAPSPALTGSSATYNDTTPQPGVTYYYRIESINALGISVPSTAITVTAPLPAPTGLTATAIGASQINLTWTADTATGLTGFVLQTSADNISWSNDITIGTGSTSISDVRLSASTEYYYRLLAVNAGGDSAPSNVVNATTTAS